MLEIEIEGVEYEFSLGKIGDLNSNMLIGEQAAERVRRETAKAWRFAGEMAEIAATFREAGLPGEFHAAAEMIYRRLAGFKDAPATPSLEEVLKILTQPSEEG